MTETLSLCLIAYLGGLIQGMTGFGVMLFDRIDQRLYRRIIYVLLFALGAMMLRKGAVGFGG